MPVNPSPAQQRDLTVARVRERPGAEFVEVMFLESARIYRLSRSHGRFGELLARLREAEEAGRGVRVTFAEAWGGEIGDVRGL